jgi:Fe-S-cluster-containing hydrogenase component 2
MGLSCNTNIKQKNPLDSLHQGNWFKLICGASYQHLPSIRNLGLIYTLAGADCLDVSADEAVIKSALEGVKVAQNLQSQAIALGYNLVTKPLLMVSINDGEDPHFRKAYFNSNLCPANCDRPCEQICPAEAIKFNSQTQGIIEALCYGCGRCLPVCPFNLINTESCLVSSAKVLSWLRELPIDALEIHTQQGHFDNFVNLWQEVRPYLSQFKLIAISCPYTPTVIDYLRQIYEQIQPLSLPLIWQTDGRPMSGDIGSGTTHLCLKYAQQVKQAQLPGFIQLAGGTNEYTVPKMRSLNLTPQEIAGIAYGSKARKLVAHILQQLENLSQTNRLEDYPDLLWQGVALAFSLVSPLKV